MSVIRKISVAAFLLFLAGMAPLFAEEAAGERYCTVKGVMGDVKVRYSPSYNKVRRERAAQGGVVAPTGGITNEWAALRLNMTVGEKCEIMTSAQSEVRLETTEGSIIKIGENTHVEVAQMQVTKQKERVDGKTEVVATVETKFKVMDGSVVASIRKLFNERTNIRFETPTATAAIRGTVIEIEAKKGSATVIRAFDGTVLVAPIGGKQFVELGPGNMAEVAPKQKIILVKPVPKDYRRKSIYLGDEKGAAGAGKQEVRVAPAAVAPEPVAVKLQLDIGSQDTINCYAGDSITVEGVVSPAGAKVSVNGLAVAPDRSGAFRLSFKVPADSGAFALNITAEKDTLAETLIRMVNVAHVYTEVRLATPAEGETVSKPVILVSGTAAPGSKVNVLGVTINVKRDGTFSGEVALPPKEGSVKVSVEIVSPDNDAVWIERNIKYRK